MHRIVDEGGLLRERDRAERRLPLSGRIVGTHRFAYAGPPLLALFHSWIARKTVVEEAAVLSVRGRVDYKCAPKNTTRECMHKLANDTGAEEHKTYGIISTAISDTHAGDTCSEGEREGIGGFPQTKTIPQEEW